MNKVFIKNANTPSLNRFVLINKTRGHTHIHTHTHTHTHIKLTPQSKMPDLLGASQGQSGARTGTINADLWV